METKPKKEKIDQKELGHQLRASHFTLGNDSKVSVFKFRTKFC
jgi:hypothetical protein